ncbi:hypothetical protein VTK26DRAFT_7054 [Humicola hyalothermophila]
MFRKFEDWGSQRPRRRCIRMAAPKLTMAVTTISGHPTPESSLWPRAAPTTIPSSFSVHSFSFTSPPNTPLLLRLKPQHVQPLQPPLLPPLPALRDPAGANQVLLRADHHRHRLQHGHGPRSGTLFRPARRGQGDTRRALAVAGPRPRRNPSSPPPPRPREGREEDRGGGAVEVWELDLARYASGGGVCAARARDAAAAGRGRRQTRACSCSGSSGPTTATRRRSRPTWWAACCWRCCCCRSCARRRS